MTSKQTHKEAIQEFKERKPQLGAYAVRCLANGRVWVGTSRNLGASRNGIWFSLRIAGHRDRSLQEEWNAHGEVAFTYEVLETLDEDVPLLSMMDVLKEKRRYWVAQLSAEALL